MSLDFDHAESTAEPQGIQCGLCRAPILDEYYQVGQTLSCQSCLDNHFSASPGFKGYLRAFVIGGIAAGLGALIDFGVSVVTGYQLGLIAILIGWMVGVGVNVGSGGRGGRLFQLMALLLAYLAISASYTGQAIKLLMNGDLEEPAPVSTPSTQEPLAPPALTSTPLAEPTAAETPLVDVTAEESPVPEEAEPEPVTFGKILLFFGFVAGLCISLPIMAAVESPILLFINAFALWQAWKMTAKVDVEGPFVVGSYAAESESEPEAGEPEIE